MEGLVFLTISFLAVLVSGKSPVTCVSNKTACDVSENNILDAIDSVFSAFECRKRCYDYQECAFFTYYGAESFPLRDFCMLLRTCDTTSTCEDCVSQTRDCYDTCGYTFTGVLAGNTVGVIPGMDSDASCQLECSKTPDCNYFTYFSSGDQALPKFCFLLTRLLGPLLPCDSCTTGPVQCADMLDCALVIDGEFITSHVITELNYIVDMFEIVSERNTKCNVRSLLVGDGGIAQDVEKNGGGGSGYVKYINISLPVGAVTPVSSRLWANATLTIEGVTTVAEFGRRGSRGDKPYPRNYSGGDGFCGGGETKIDGSICDGYFSGGSNGGDGQGAGLQGHGTGEDVTKYLFDNWVISPGVAGRSAYCGGSGGGGGGVLVNGYSPPRDSNTVGEGYGGGGSGGSEDEAYRDISMPLDGIILIEVGKENP